jgi:hypothetical protein
LSTARGALAVIGFVDLASVLRHGESLRLTSEFELYSQQKLRCDAPRRVSISHC